MKKFNVTTPEEWKYNLSEKIACNKTNRIASFKPLIAVAAAFAVIAAAVPAFASGSVTKWLNQWFLGSSTLTESLYSEKNIVFNGSSENIEVVCTGIMGDKYNVVFSVKVNATGSSTFEKKDADLFVFGSHSFLLPDGTQSDVISAVDLSRIDPKTLQADYFVSLNSKNETPEKISITLSDLVLLCENGDTKIIESGDFTAEIPLDYSDTGVALSPVQSAKIFANSYSSDASGSVVSESSKITAYSPESFEISNVSARMTLSSADVSIPDFTFLSGDFKQEHIPFNVITLTLSDGSEINYSTVAKNNETKHLLINKIASENGNLIISGIFEEAVDASKVTGIKLDGQEFFVK